MYSCKCLKEKNKVWISIRTALIAALIFSPQMFMLMSSITGDSIAGPGGMATPVGLLVHGLLFALILWLLMKPTGFSFPSMKFTPSAQMDSSVAGMAV
jgi:hypothetical protein